MALPPVSLTKLIMLRTLLRTESVSETARLLSRAQPSVTATLGELRAFYDDRLLVRVGARMRRSAFAERLMPALDAFASGADEVLAQRPGFDPARDARFFRISASDYQASLIAPALARALNAAPLVDVDLRPSGDGVEAVRRGTVTLALITGSEPAAGFLPRHICTDPFCVLYDPGHGTAPDGLADFAARDFVQAAPSGLRGGAVDSALADHGLTRRVRVMAGPLTLAGRLVQGTAAMAVLPETLARMFVPLGLATAPLPLDIAPATTWLIRSQRPAGDIAVDWLVDRLAPQSLRGKA